MANFVHRREGSSRWLIPALVLFLLLTGAAVLWTLIENASHTSLIRVEAEKELLVSDLSAAVQVESEHAGVFAGDMASRMSETGMSQMEAPESGSGGLLADNPGLLAAIASFGEAAGSLRFLMSEGEHQVLDDVVAAHHDYLVSLAALDTLFLNGQETMSFYHGDTQTVEATMRARVQELRLASNSQLQSAIDEAGSTETQFRTALPLLLLVGMLAAGFLVRAQSTRRRIVALEHLVEAKAEFIAAVSHELRTPLTAVVGFADLLRDPNADLSASDRTELMAGIAEQSDEVTAIVEDLLVAARTDIGELAVVVVPIDLRAQTAQVLETLDQGGSIAVVGTAPKGIGDPVRVRQVLRNLITNAKRYGGDQIRVEIDSRGDTHASITIKDNGDPIPVEDRERIFQPYERAHNQPGKTGSIGLGLAVSQRLARLMGGDLTYHHESGHSNFEFSLPLADAVAPESEPLVVAANR